MKALYLDTGHYYQPEIDKLLTTPEKKYTLISLKHAFTRFISWQDYFRLLSILKEEKKISIGEDGDINWSNNPKNILYGENRRWTLDEINRLEQEYIDDLGEGSENLSTRINDIVYWK